MVPLTETIIPVTRALIIMIKIFSFGTSTPIVIAISSPSKRASNARFSNKIITMQMISTMNTGITSAHFALAKDPLIQNSTEDNFFSLFCIKIKKFDIEENKAEIAVPEKISFVELTRPLAPAKINTNTEDTMAPYPLRSSVLSSASSALTAQGHPSLYQSLQKLILQLQALL